MSFDDDFKSCDNEWIRMPGDSNGKILENLF